MGELAAVVDSPCSESTKLRASFEMPIFFAQSVVRSSRSARVRTISQSARTCLRIFGRCTLTATTRPSQVTARWT